MRKIKVSELVLDYDFYPRSSVDAQNVGYIAEAMAAGMELPPIVIDKKSKRVIDGFHRVKAMIRANKGDTNVPITAIERSYPNDAEMFLDAVRLNASHGSKLTSFDRSHSLIIADRLSVDPDAIATAMNMTIAATGKLRVDRVAQTIRAGSSIPLKQTIKHMAGKKLTKAQVEANKRLGGMNQVHYANQLITLIENDLLDLGNEKLIERLSRLGELIGGLAVAV